MARSVSRSSRGKPRRPGSAAPPSRPAGARQVRIIAGDFRGRRLTFPDLPGLRPTADRVRETLFNWLQADVIAEDCLDLFAGSGACGFECLSRGAHAVTFVDRSAEVCEYLQKGAKQLLGDQANTGGERQHSHERQNGHERQKNQNPEIQIVRSNAQDYLSRIDGREAKFGLVFLDPPFADDCLLEISEMLEKSGCLKSKALIYVESGSAVPLTNQLVTLDNWHLLKEKKAGAVRFALFQRQSCEDKIRHGLDDN